MNEVPVRLLRETLESRVPPGPPGECLDAETIAAWADDTLGRDERRAVEAHAADCARCQALVAAMARTAPPAAARSWWRAPVMGWLVPLTAVATALLVWMNLPPSAVVPPATTLLREIKQEPRPPQNALSSVRPVPSPDNANQEKRVPLPPKQDLAKVNRGPQPSAVLDGAQSASIDKPRNEAPAPLAKGFSDAAGEAAAPAASPAPAAPITAAAQSAPAAAPAAAAPPPPQLAAADSLAAGQPPPTVRRTTAATASVNARALMLLEARRSASLIVSSNASSQWRILANGAVQHSTDSGLT